MKEYIDKIDKTIIRISERALRHKNGKAWDNAKVKADKRHRPRGKVFRKMLHREISAEMKKHVESLQESINMLT